MWSLYSSWLSSFAKNIHPPPPPLASFDKQREFRTACLLRQGDMEGEGGHAPPVTVVVMHRNPGRKSSFSIMTSITMTIKFLQFYRRQPYRLRIN